MVLNIPSSISRSARLHADLRFTNIANALQTSKKDKRHSTWKLCKAKA